MRTCRLISRRGWRLTRPGALAVLILALAWPLLPAAAQAQAPAAAGARSHYERGTSFYNLGQFEEAIAEYRKGYELKADPVFLFNIAQSYRQLSANDKALFFYRRYLSVDPGATNRAQVEERIAQLEKLTADQALAKSAPPPSPEAPAATAPSRAPYVPIPVSPRAPESAAAPSLAASEPTPPASLSSPAPSLTNEVVLTTTPSEPAPVHKRWWFWTAIGGAIVLGVVVTGVALASGDETQPPTTPLGSMRYSF